jgi:hypothetical protein
MDILFVIGVLATPLILFWGLFDTMRPGGLH